MKGLLLLLILSFAKLGAWGQAVDSASVEPDTCILPIEKQAEPLNYDAFRQAVGWSILEDYYIEGVVLMRVLVGTDGTVMDYRLLRSPHQLLTKQVVQHICMLVFTPGCLHDGTPIIQWVNVPVRFRLR